jgi:hypothetical protein
VYSLPQRTDSLRHLSLLFLSSRPTDTWNQVVLKRSRKRSEITFVLPTFKQYTSEEREK